MHCNFGFGKKKSSEMWGSKWTESYAYIAGFDALYNTHVLSCSNGNTAPLQWSAGMVGREF